MYFNPWNWFWFRFFASKEEKSETPTVLRENSPEKKNNGEDLTDVGMDISMAEESIKEEEVESKSDILPVVKSNKENIAHR